MFSVIFEVLPNKENWDNYFYNAKMLRPELEQVEGFVDNIRYKSLTREGWILSLSNWRDEKSLVRWRTRRRLTPLCREGPACCEFDPALAQARAAEQPRSISRGDSDDTRSRRPAE